MPDPLPDRVPVTVLTGYLGAGKTTLLNRILKETHGRRYAVVVNEFGAEGIDGGLLIESEEEIIETNDGCLCCTVRGDLVRIVEGLRKRKDTLDGIILETTGLADPGPIVQTFLNEPTVAAWAALDAIVTVADAAHLEARLADAPEAEVQLAVADLVLLNKADLAGADGLDRVEGLIRAMNPEARVIRTQRCDVPIDQILGQGAFSLERTVARAGQFLTPQPINFGVASAPVRARHDSSITSVSLTADRPLDEAKLTLWLRGLLLEQGASVLRLKGILDFIGNEQRTVIQGVHMLLDGGELGPWPAGEPRRSRLVLIGRGLDEAALRQGFAGTAAG